MSQPVPQPVPAPVPDWLASTPEWTGAPGATSQRGWVPPAPAVPPPGVTARSRGPLALAVVAAAAEGLCGPLPQDSVWTPGPPLDPADVGEPTPPVTGPDPVLDGYAQGCFEGVYPACDGLFFESPPMSDYEEYGATCGGRIEPYAVGSCTDLD